MIWLTWRQFRAQATAVFVLLVALAAALALTGPGVADDLATGLASCTGQSGGCDTFLRLFFDDYQSLFLSVTAILLVLPVFIGLFWGAPLISRELETGTHRLVWNQSITRTRWLAVKLVLTGVAAIAVTALGDLAVSWWSSTLDQAADEVFPRLGSLVFDARGVVPIGYAAFAFTLGVTVGMLVRRALPAMAVTLAVFVAVQIAMPLLVRPHLLAPTDTTVEISRATLDGFMFGDDGLVLEGKAPDVGGWLLSSDFVDRSGNVVEVIPISRTSGPCAPSTTPEETMATCFAELSRLGYRQHLTYHAPTRFWPFQWIETAIYTAVALCLAGFCFWWLRRRLS